MPALYYTDIRDLSEDASYTSLISSARLQKMQRYRRPQDRLRSLAAALLLQHLFGSDAAILENDFNKPYISGDLHFNLSHSGDFVILLCAKSEVGCDIEKHGIKDFDGIAAKILHPLELEYYNSHKSVETFYKFWTLKESYLKCIGTGFHLAPASFCINLSEQISLLETPQKDFKECTFQIINHLTNYTIATCIKGVALTNLSLEQIHF
ncbi:MAG: 4'-phosphopantetheinyl transferase family protein [Bdellovibrionota bacterium]|jgi:4'-phosphopantetheinyl transferase